MPLKRALAWTAFWFATAVAFGIGVTASRGSETGIAFFTAYLVEQALSVDNLFVMMVVFSRLRIKGEYQHRVLMWGIAGVVILRGLMIATGTALIGAFHFLTYGLGALLLYTAYKLARGLDAPHDTPETPSIVTRMQRVLGRVLPLTDKFEGNRFTTWIGGVRHATPLLVAVVAIEVCDAIFALDSIPAVLGVTTDPFVVATSNLFAVLGLRSLYFAVQGALGELRYLQHGLVGVLALVGAKMLLALVWPVPAWLSLSLVTLTLGGAVVASLLATPQPQENECSKTVTTP